MTEAFGDRAVFLRPGVILGPEEYVGRLPWWLTRAERGGRILAPAPADRRIQPVDVRDVAAFALDRAASDTWALLAGNGRPVENPRWAEHGIAPDKEAKVLASL
ncbi:hypothetical protein [Streptomyces sp. NPDC053560]|uniref:hypothetical protein n=1 Tax=Streptomyces sp. NPDC053560 TaxID=3365711 RepID=UPI0037D4C0FD